MTSGVLEIEDLHTYFATVDGTVKAVNGVSLRVDEDSVLGIVGESGSGKTVTALSVLQLVPVPGDIVSGSIRYDGRELVGLDNRAMRAIRGNEVAMVFQDAVAALNPTINIGEQIVETVLEHTDMSNRAARERAIELLTQMGIGEAKGILGRYPFEISGGVAQRVMVAIAIALRPRLLIADEPTSNLDVTMQAQILHRLQLLRREQRSALVLITHDLGVLAQIAETVAVMYGGHVVETASTRDLFARPLHPYTWGLMQAVPRLDSEPPALTPIKGTLPKMLDPPDQCPYLARCPKAISACRTDPMPPMREVEGGHEVACYNPIEHEQDAGAGP